MQKHYRPLRRLTWWMQTLLTVCIASDLMAGFAAVIAPIIVAREIAQANDFVRGMTNDAFGDHEPRRAHFQPGREGLVERAKEGARGVWENSSGFLALVFGLIELLQRPLDWITGLVFLKWVYRTTRTIGGLSGTATKYSPTTAAASFCIPIVNVLVPPFVMYDLWRRSHRNTANATVPVLWTASRLLASMTAIMTLLDFLHIRGTELQRQLLIGGTEAFELIFAAASSVIYLAITKYMIARLLVAYQSHLGGDDRLVLATNTDPAAQ